MKPCVLLVEDEKSISEIIALNLEIEGYEVVTVADGTIALQLVESDHEKFSLVILDIMLPGVNGLEVCSFIKKKNPALPVMLVTAKGETEDRVRGLKTGADDYLVKPFDLEELLLRTRNLTRRFSGEKNIDLVEFNGNRIDFNTWEAYSYTGNKVQLTKREFLLLKLLVERKNEVVSRDEILEKVWQVDENPSSRTIDNMVLTFRKYFEKNIKEPVHFLSIRGVGYKLVL